MTNFGKFAQLKFQNNLYCCIKVISFHKKLGMFGKLPVMSSAMYVHI